jgi:predicted AAA+ superfamily ATPase
VWEDALAAAGSLSVLHGVLDDAAGRLWVDLVEMLAARSPEPARLTAAYGRLFTLLAEEIELASEPPVGDAWQHHLLSHLLTDVNPFSQKAERAGLQAMGPALLAQTRAELASLQRCYRLGGAAVAQAVGRIAGRSLPSWEGFRPLVTSAPRSSRHRMMQWLSGARDWSGCARELARYIAANGVGLFGQFRAFRWIHVRESEGRLEGVPHPDPIRLDDLVGYDMERQPVVDNTRQFVAGLPSNNVLLYGDRGTGKSSTVKALLTEFHPQGLRLIEVSKEHLGDYVQILAPLRGRRERFILFVDDLSFEEHETQYKALKAALEGSLEARPENVVLYATSNRRRLIRERFSDRKGPALDDDVHVEETVQEKLSLADRFGIHVPFLAPDQDRYLEIAAALAARDGVRLPAREVRRRALLWSQWHNGHSCRTARQFVDALRGEMAAGLAVPAVLDRARPVRRPHAARGRGRVR